MNSSRSEVASYAFDWDGPAAYAPVDLRAAFIQKTYLHLGGAVLLFIAIEAAIFNLVPMEMLDANLRMLFASRFGWLAIVGGFVAVGWVARSWAESEASTAMQYLGLGLYTVAEAVVFVPILYIAATRVDPIVIPASGIITALVFGGLTAFVMLTKADFSGWGHYLWLAGIAAMGIVIAAIVFNFSMGVWFAGGMVVLASMYILYDTSNVLHHYRTTQHVAAALALFSSVATLFYYILRILMAFSRRD
jgi:FtsH-binding integral membrane protein